MPPRQAARRICALLMNTLRESNAAAAWKSDTENLFRLSKRLSVLKRIQYCFGLSTRCGIIPRRRGSDGGSALQAHKAGQRDKLCPHAARLRRPCGRVDVYDTPFTDVNDDEGIVRDAEYAKSLGFSGKSAIAPAPCARNKRSVQPVRKGY